MTAWDEAEKEFEGFYRKKGNYLYAFEDTREALRTGGSRRVFTKARPSDYLVTSEGVTFFAEVKYCSNATSFPFSNIAPEQFAAALQCTMAKGLYLFFIKSSITNLWYKVPASVILELWETQRSIKWTELHAYVFRQSPPL